MGTRRDRDAAPPRRVKDVPWRVERQREGKWRTAAVFLMPNGTREEEALARYRQLASLQTTDPLRAMKA